MIYFSTIVCISLVVVLIQLMMAYQKRAHDLRMMQEPIRRRIRLQKQAMLDAIELLHVTSDARLEKLIEEAETHKLESTQFAMVLESWKDRMGPEEIEETEETEETEEIGEEVDAEMELLDEDEEFELLEKRGLELEIRNLLSQFAKVQEELDNDNKGLDRAFDTAGSIMNRLDAKVLKLGDDATKN